MRARSANLNLPHSHQAMRGHYRSMNQFIFRQPRSQGLSSSRPLDKRPWEQGWYFAKLAIWTNSRQKKRVYGQASTRFCLLLLFCDMNLHVIQSVLYIFQSGIVVTGDPLKHIQSAVMFYSRQPINVFRLLVIYVPFPGDSRMKTSVMLIGKLEKTFLPIPRPFIISLFQITTIMRCSGGKYRLIYPLSIT